MESEQATRKARIDPRLNAAGWSVTPFDPAMPSAIPAERAVEEWPTKAGPADYALCDEHAVRAVVEAKKQATGAQGILPQAARYSRAIQIDIAWQGEYGVPFLYATNGEETWFHDVRLPRTARARLRHSTRPMRCGSCSNATVTQNSPSYARFRCIHDCGRIRWRPTQRSSKPSPTASARCS